MAEKAGYPAYYWRYFRPNVAWFCKEGDAKSFLQFGEDYGNLFADGLEPKSGVDYQDQGHFHCFADECPDDDCEPAADGEAGL